MTVRAVVAAEWLCGRRGATLLAQSMVAVRSACVGVAAPTESRKLDAGLKPRLRDALAAAPVVCRTPA